MKYKTWKLPECIVTAPGALEGAGIPALACAVLRARGFNAPDEARAFLEHGAELLHDPMLLRDMDTAVAHIKEALTRGTRMAIYGDYDVDGITATCLLTDYLRRAGAWVTAYIPDRVEEGYGLNASAIAALHEQGVELIITVDCGITAVDEVAYARELGMDVIVTDHHECKQTLPDAVAVINPHRDGCDYPFPHLAGVGVALKLVMALGGPEMLYEYADLTAIGTVADVVCMQGENRAIVSIGLDCMARTRRPGLNALLRQAGADGSPMTATTIGYMLAPRLNAAGRLDCAQVAADLLLTGDLAQAEELAETLCQLNRRRQEIEGKIYTDCIALLERARVPDAIVLADEDWHQGVVGIVASRLSERYSRPAFMICLNGGKGKGSCRSYGGFNLFAALEGCTDLLESFGGHELAAGFTIAEEHIPAFRERMEGCVARWTQDAQVGAALQIDVELEHGDCLTIPEVEGLSLLEPHGAGNERPVFLLSGCTVLAAGNVGGGKHLKLKLGWAGMTLGAIFFSATCEGAGVKTGDRIDVAATLGINEFRGVTSVQLQLQDLRPARTRMQTERALYERMRAGGMITACEAKSLIPTREEFAAVWRYLVRNGTAQEVEQGICRFVREVARNCRLRETYRTMVCLDTMRECGLIELEYGPQCLRVRVNETQGKANLESSAIMQQLRSMAGE